MSEKKATPTEHWLANKWIKELTEAGYTPDDMMAIFKEARRKYHDFKKIKEKHEKRI